MRNIFFLTLILFMKQAQAVQFEGFDFPSEIMIVERKLVLNGLALRKVPILGIRVLVGGLYLPQPFSEASGVETMVGPKQLRLHFLKNLSAKTIAKTWTTELMKNCENSCPIVKEKATKLEAMISDIKKDDLLAITFDKNQVTFQLNTQKGGVIEGAEFALAFLRVWIGPRPINEDFKKDLLRHYNKQGDEK